MFSCIYNYSSVRIDGAFPCISIVSGAWQLNCEVQGWSESLQVDYPQVNTVLIICISQQNGFENVENTRQINRSLGSAISAKRLLSVRVMHPANSADMGVRGEDRVGGFPQRRPDVSVFENQARGWMVMSDSWQSPKLSQHAQQSKCRNLDSVDLAFEIQTEAVPFSARAVAARTGND